MRDLFMIVLSIGAAQSLFWGIFLFANKKLDTYKSRLVALLFIFFGIRVGKSMAYLYMDNVPLTFLNIGFSAHLLIGPTLYLYLLRSTELKSPKWPLLHFIPGMAVLIFSSWLDVDSFWYMGGYTAILCHSMLYLIYSIFLFTSSIDKIERARKIWLTMLLVGFGLVLIAYFSNYILRVIDYAMAPLLYSFVVYVLSFYLFQNQHFILNKSISKYQNIHLPKEKAALYKKRIVEHFEENRPYLDANYNLAQLSQDIGIPKYLLSHVFNISMEISFLDFMNTYRIELAKSTLENKTNLKVASIAYDSGFNSISSFNQAFKRITQMTPSAFRSSRVE